MFQQIPLLDMSKKSPAKCDFQRRACDLSGKLGSLYDARTDTFVKHHPLRREPVTVTTQAMPVCEWFDGSKNTSGLLDMLEMEDELSLSLYLGMCGSNLHGRASLINYEKSIDSRTLFLLYSYTTGDQWLPSDSFSASALFENQTLGKPNGNATHIVYRIIWGFEVLFVIQIPSTNVEGKDYSDITCLMTKICDTLKQSASMPIKLTKDEKNLWTTLNVFIKATSPILSFDQTTDILPIITRIQHFQDSWFGYQHPLIYIFQPIKWIYNKACVIDYNSLEKGHVEESKRIQRALYLVQNALNRLNVSLQLLEETDKQKVLLPQTRDIKNKLHQMQDNRRVLLQNLTATLLDVRAGKQNLSKLFRIAGSIQYDLLRGTTLNPLISECEKLCNKTGMISQLKEEHFEYVQITDEENASTKERISKLFAKSIQSVHVLCSSDELMAQDEQQWNACRQTLIKKRNKDSNVRLIYADLSYCKHEDVKKTTCFSFGSQSTKQAASMVQPLPQHTEINILLLGESGVGKSTFINAFVNYLTFDSLKQAEDGEPSVLIPVSFVLTIPHELEEVVVKFGGIDVNEDHDHPGQSVTQYCRSYVFDINQKIRLRLIDTPGIGDTRGLDQDFMNINEILSYVNNFSHINAVCILLKPNATRLNSFLRSCITQIFTYLTPAASDNIIFCFTNTRSTFFAPGNTAPLLKSMLKELPLVNIPFGRTNTFCFDSESFRYLTAVKQKVMFSNEHQRQQYHKSWTSSSVEAERLLKFIYELKPYCVSQWQSEKHAKLEVLTMVRPIMETFRKVLFTMILQKQQRSNVSIELTPKPVDGYSAVCYTGGCKVKRIQREIFGLVQYPVHLIPKPQNTTMQQCTTCRCDLSKHMIIEYELDYGFVSMAKAATPIKREDIDWWLNLCYQFAGFIGSIDSFFVHLDRFIGEERVFTTLNQGTEKSEYAGNARMHAELVTIKKILVKYIKQRGAEKKVDLVEIYRLINESKALPDIKLQIDAIKQSRRTILKSEERFIPKPFGSTGILYRIADQDSA